MPRLRSLACIVLLATSALAASTPQLPKTPAGRRLHSLLRAFDSGDPAEIRDFIAANYSQGALRERPAAARAATYMQLFQETGGFQLRQVEQASDHEITVVTQSRLAEDWYRITCPVEAAPPHGIVGVVFRLVPRPAALAPPGRMNDAAIVAELDRYLPKLAKAGLFTGVVLFARNGQPLFAKAYGRDDHGPFTLDSRFGLASINKVFTAVAVAQLAQQGKLAFQDPIGKYLPDYPRPQGEKITIHHLLTHTSGTESFLDNRDWEEAQRAGVRNLAQLAGFIGKRPLVAPPGTKFLYSNAGYSLLQAIIENVSRRSFEEYVRQQVYAPAGMTATADGMSTAPDLARFAAALQSGKLLSPETARLLMEPKVATDDPDTRYAYGLEVETVNGTRIVGHPGGAPNVSAQLDLYPGSGYTVVVLSTRPGNTAQRAATRLREMLTQK